jgi:hypothetical protein
MREEGKRRNSEGETNGLWVEIVRDDSRTSILCHLKLYKRAKVSYYEVILNDEVKSYERQAHQN